MDFPEPVISLAIEPKTKADQEKLGQGLGKLMNEDPTFRVKTDQDTGEVVIAGMGELHLEIIVDRLKREFNVEASVGRPQVAYKETLTRPADGEMKYAKQTGGRGQYGHVKIHLFPGEPGTGYIFENETTQRLDSEGVHQADRRRDQGSADPRRARRLPGGRRAHRAYDGSYHDVDSSEMAFKIAGSMAFQDAAKKAKPVLLEPVMRVEVVVPKEHMGDVIGNLIEPPRPHPVAGRSRRHADHQRARAAVRDVRLRDRPPLAHAGPRDLLDALRSLRAGAESRERRSRRAGAGK